MSAIKKRTTVYLLPEIHKALRLKSAETGNSLSDILNQMGKEMLLEDKEDIEAFVKREKEPVISYEDFLSNLEADDLVQKA